MLCKIHKAVNNKKGEQAIIMVIGFMIMLLLLTFFLDVVVISRKHAALSDTAGMIARLAALQGGVLDSAPNGYDSAYTNRSELLDKIAVSLKSAGISKQAVNVEINGKDIFKTETDKLDYGSIITVTMKLRYSFKYISAIPTKEMNVVRVAISEFKYRYDDWDGDR